MWGLGEGHEVTHVALRCPASISHFYLAPSPLYPLFSSPPLSLFTCPPANNSLHLGGSVSVWIMEEAGFALTRCVWWLTSTLLIRARVCVRACPRARAPSRCTPFPLLNYSPSNLFPPLPRKPFRWRHLGLQSVNRRRRRRGRGHGEKKKTSPQKNKVRQTHVNDGVWLTRRGFCWLFASFMLSRQGWLVFICIYT